MQSVEFLVYPLVDELYVIAEFLLLKSVRGIQHVIPRIALENLHVNIRQVVFGKEPSVCVDNVHFVVQLLIVESEVSVVVKVSLYSFGAF